MEGYTHFPRETFEKHVETFYPLGVELLSREMGHDIRLALQSLLRRIGEVRMGMPLFQTPSATPSATPTSPRSTTSAFPVGRRRTSTGR
jgi:brefeldin A-inhibited guanine nucleotide-exchange protein